MHSLGVGEIIKPRLLLHPVSFLTSPLQLPPTWAGRWWVDECFSPGNPPTCQVNTPTLPTFLQLYQVVEKLQVANSPSIVYKKQLIILSFSSDSFVLMVGLHSMSGIRHLLWWQLLLRWYLRQQWVRVRVMIGFLVQGRVRIKIRIRVMVRH